jgi:hypothetical protein
MIEIDPGNSPTTLIHARLFPPEGGPSSDFTPPNPTTEVGPKNPPVKIKTHTSCPHHIFSTPWPRPSCF